MDLQDKKALISTVEEIRAGGHDAELELNLTWFSIRTYLCAGGRI